MKGPFDQDVSTFFEEALFKKAHFQAYLGAFDEKIAFTKNMKIATGSEQDSNGAQLRLHLLVDQEDGVIADVKFQVFGSSIYYLILEALAELVLLKSYPQAGKISSQLIENRLKRDCKFPLPALFNGPINSCLFALDEAIKACEGIAVDAELVTPLENDQAPEEIPGWLNLELKTQLEILEKVIASDIRPYIELDEGGIEIISLKEGIFLTIAYKGACVTCHSSTGSTLTAIEQILRNKVFPALVVIPDSSWLKR